MNFEVFYSKKSDNLEQWWDMTWFLQTSFKYKIAKCKRENFILENIVLAQKLTPSASLGLFQSAKTLNY